jgi:hypothetical protein
VAPTARAVLTRRHLTHLRRTGAVKTASEPRVSAPVLIAAAAPVCLATLAVIVFVVFELSGRTLSSEGPLRNLAEAAAMGSVSEVVRFLEAGENPNRLVDVRPFAISSSIRRVTGLEAAVWHRSVQLIQFLDRTGAIGTGETRRRLACLAADLRVEDIVKYLAPDGASWCVPGQTLADIEARSREQ